MLWFVSVVCFFLIEESGFVPDTGSCILYVLDLNLFLK